MSSNPAGIQKLHQQDIDATVSMDVGKLTDLWADDGVLLGQGDKPLVGQIGDSSLIDAELRREPDHESSQIRARGHRSPSRGRCGL